MDIEKQSAAFSHQNLDIASQRYKLGLSSFVEYRTVEQSYEETVFRLSQAMFNTKISELNYLKAQGLLIH
jgi:outer membrane protein TolC